MEKCATDAKVDEFFKKATTWKKELLSLRKIILSCQLTEDYKWRNPCYTFENKNIVIIGRFKKHCALSFFKGVLLKDPKTILCSPGENSQTFRMVQFTNVKEINKVAQVLKEYIHEAVEVEKAGLKVEYKKVSDFDIPEEFQNTLDKNPKIKAAFEALTPGRQKGYLLHFSAPKQSKTRVSRIGKCTKRILDGKGLNDCTCGLSQRMPACDGSHSKLRS